MEFLAFKWFQPAFNAIIECIKQFKELFKKNLYQKYCLIKPILLLHLIGKNDTVEFFMVGRFCRFNLENGKVIDICALWPQLSILSSIHSPHELQRPLSPFLQKGKHPSAPPSKIRSSKSKRFLRKEEILNFMALKHCYGKWDESCLTSANRQVDIDPYISKWIRPEKK